MAVLIEAISVVAKAARVIEAFGSFERFKAIVPNGTLAADNELVRVGFMAPYDVEHFIEELGTFGLIYLNGGTARDIVVVDQVRGPMARCDWIEVGHVEIAGHRVAAARLAGSASKQLSTPEGWTVEGSLSATFGFVPTGEKEKSLTYLRTDSRTDVYWNSLTGREVYVGRTSKSDDA